MSPLLHSALLCLSLNIYHEARGEPETGQLAVGFVTLTRARERRQTICETVFEPKQFSWTEDALDDGRMLKVDWIPDDSPAWQQAHLIAWRLLKRRIQDFTGGANLYYAVYIKPPKWAAQATYVMDIGQHRFYREER